MAIVTYEEECVPAWHGMFTRKAGNNAGIGPPDAVVRGAPFWRPEGTGFIDLNQVAKAMRALGIPPTAKDLKVNISPTRGTHTHAPTHTLRMCAHLDHPLRGFWQAPVKQAIRVWRAKQ